MVTNVLLPPVVSVVHSLLCLMALVEVASDHCGHALELYGPQCWGTRCSSLSPHCDL